MSPTFKSSQSTQSAHLSQESSPKFYCKPALFESKSQVMDNWIVFHRTLSDAAKILIFALNGIFTCTHTWVPVQSDIQKRLSWGKEKMRNTMKECEKYGFLRVQQRRNKVGEFACHDFEFCIDASFKEKTTNIPQEKPPHSEYEPETGLPCTDNRNPDNQPLPSSNDLPRSKEDTYKDNVLRDGGNVDNSKPIPKPKKTLETLPSYKSNSKTLDAPRRWSLKGDQLEAFNFLDGDHIDTDDDTKCAWTKKYSLQRLIEVYEEAKAAKNVRSIGAYMQRLLIDGSEVKKAHAPANKEFAQYLKCKTGWQQLEILQKYVKYPCGNGFEELSYNMLPDHFQELLTHKQESGAHNG